MRLWVLMIAFVLGFPLFAWSQCAAPGSMCGDYDRAELVFLADVESVQPEVGPTRSGTVTQVHFRVLETFKGRLGPTLTLPLHPSSEESRTPRGNVFLSSQAAGRMDGRPSVEQQSPRCQIPDYWY